jgi:hypothetical protein
MVRRVITQIDHQGRSVIANDGPTTAVDFRHTPGFSQSLVWTTQKGASPSPDGTATPANYIPGPGETIAMTVTFPPDAVFGDPQWDPALAV